MSQLWQSSRVASIVPSATVSMTDRVKTLRAAPYLFTISRPHDLTAACAVPPLRPHVQPDKMRALAAAVARSVQNNVRAPDDFLPFADFIPDVFGEILRRARHDFEALRS